MKPRLWPRCWKRVPAPLMRELAREVRRHDVTGLVEGPSGYAGHELVIEMIGVLECVPSDSRETRSAVLASALYSLAEMGDYIGELCCRVPRCTRKVWPSFDGVCFEHGMNVPARPAERE